MSTYVSVVISPATTTSPVVISTSQATRPCGSSARTASRTASETWSATLSGCPSVTDSEVKRNSRAMCRGRLVDGEKPRELDRLAVLRPVEGEVLQRLEVRGQFRWSRPAAHLEETKNVGNRGLQVHVTEARRLVRNSALVQRVLGRRGVGPPVAVFAQRRDA